MESNPGITIGEKQRAGSYRRRAQTQRPLKSWMSAKAGSWKCRVLGGDSGEMTKAGVHDRQEPLLDSEQILRDAGASPTWALVTPGEHARRSHGAPARGSIRSAPSGKGQPVPTWHLGQLAALSPRAPPPTCREPHPCSAGEEGERKQPRPEPRWAGGTSGGAGLSCCPCHTGDTAVEIIRE